MKGKPGKMTTVAITDLTRKLQETLAAQSAAGDPWRADPDAWGDLFAREINPALKASGSVAAQDLRDLYVQIAAVADVALIPNYYFDEADIILKNDVFEAVLLIAKKDRDVAADIRDDVKGSYLQGQDPMLRQGARRLIAELDKIISAQAPGFNTAAERKNAAESKAPTPAAQDKKLER